MWTDDPLRVEWDVKKLMNPVGLFKDHLYLLEKEMK